MSNWRHTVINESDDDDVDETGFLIPAQKAKCGRQAWTPTGTFDVEQDYDDDVGMIMIMMIMMMMLGWWWLWWWCLDGDDYDDQMSG